MSLLLLSIRIQDPGTLFNLRIGIFTGTIAGGIVGPQGMPELRIGFRPAEADFARFPFGTERENCRRIGRKQALPFGIIPLNCSSAWRSCFFVTIKMC